jgi:beta-ribofuranosylaminobenzene 5'-phosphate synthase
VTVEVEATARLHFGFLDLSGGVRRFGGLGLSIDRPRLVLRCREGRGLVVEGAEPDRVADFAARFYAAAGRPPAAHLEVVETIPAHVGLGSGTQTALAVAAGLARLHRVEAPLARLAAWMGRGRRSGIGLHAFEHGGFLVEGGHPSGGDRGGASGAPDALPAPPPLLTRHDFPEGWRIVVCVPRGARAVSGPEEDEAFLRLPAMPDAEAGRLARAVLGRLLPALVERDLVSFGGAIETVQEIVGACFAGVQGGAYHAVAAPVAARLRSIGACGVGQSSWGPAVYAFAADGRDAEPVAAACREAAPHASVLQARAANHGARLEER